MWRSFGFRCRMCSTFFGNDRNSPYHAEPGIVPLMQDAKGRWRPDAGYVAPVRDAKTVVQVTRAIGPVGWHAAACWRDEGEGEAVGRKELG